MFCKDLTEKPFGKSVRVFEVNSRVIDDLYAHRNILVEDWPVYPNQPVILKAGKQSALGYVNRSGTKILPADEDIHYFSIGGRNKEQILLQNLFQDPDIRLLVVTGAAGTGKTTMIGSYVMNELLQAAAFERLLLSKPLEIVTSTRYWGTVPGDENDKFAPFLKSYQIMFEGLTGENGKSYVETMIAKGIIQFFPLELMRGASLKRCMCWYDEAQNLNHHEMKTLGSRIDDVGKSKLILSGDLNQRDKRISVENSGLHKLVSSKHFLESPHTAHVHLIKNERGVISQLFYDVFDKDED